MGRWIEDPRELPHGWRYERDTPPDGQQPATTLLSSPVPRVEFETADGARYVRAHPDEFPEAT